MKNHHLRERLFHTLNNTNVAPENRHIKNKMIIIPNRGNKTKYVGMGIVSAAQIP